MSQDLDRLKALAEKATPGPWQAVADDHPQGQPAPYYAGLVCQIERSGERTTAVVAGGEWVPSRQWEANAQFIAASRSALPGLVEEVERLREALKPFASAYDDMADLRPGPDIDHWPARFANLPPGALTLGDLRRARQALSQTEGDFRG